MLRGWRKTMENKEDRYSHERQISMNFCHDNLLKCDYGFGDTIFKLNEANNENIHLKELLKIVAEELLSHDNDRSAITDSSIKDMIDPEWNMSFKITLRLKEAQEIVEIAGLKE
jgi:hypothetical protein